MVMVYKHVVAVQLDDELYDIVSKNAMENERTIPQEIRLALRKHYKVPVPAEIINGCKTKVF